jgi:hypothetical protein
MDETTTPTPDVKLNRWRQYFADVFVPHKDDIEVFKATHALSKWWLEQVRNLLAVSAIYFLSQKSDSLTLHILAYATALIFLWSFTTWQLTFSLRLLPYIKNPKLNFRVNCLLWLLVVMPIYYSVLLALASVYGALTKLAQS